MFYPVISLILINSINLPPPHPFYPKIPQSCSKLSPRSCLDTYRCGFCVNETWPFDDDDFIGNNSHHFANGSGTCIDIGYCGIGTIYGEQCINVITGSSCFLIKVAVLTFFLIICINLVYCIIRGIQTPLLKSNYSIGCKRTTITFLYCLIFIPLVTFYFINFTVFMYTLLCSAVLGIIFWCCYGGNAVIKIINNERNTRNNRNIETTALLVNE